MNLVLFLSYIVVLIFWCFISILTLLIYLCSGGGNELDRVYDKCNITDAIHQYIVRVIYGYHKKDYNPKEVHITLEILDTKGKSLTKLTITPKQMKKSVEASVADKKVAKFLLFRKQPLLDIAYVVINHNSKNGQLFISMVEIQETNSELANIAYVGTLINSLPKDKSHVKQKFPSGSTEKREMEDLVSGSPTLSCIEFIAFVFMAINIILVLCVFVIPCTTSTFCRDYRDELPSSAFAAMLSSFIAFVVFVVSILLYRYLIKPLYYRASGQGFYSCLRMAYIVSIVLIGVICGILAAYFASNENKFDSKVPSKLNHEIYWMLACGIGVIILVLLWFPCFALIAYFVGFFSTSSSKQLKSGIKSKSKTKSNGHETMRTLSSESYGQTYYAQLTKTTKNVKSISQYPGLQSKSQSKLKSKKAPKSVKRSASQESMGENYYEQLIKKGQGKVKSVSQYQGIQN